MTKANMRTMAALATIGALLTLAIGIAMFGIDESTQVSDENDASRSAGSWSGVTEGFLAVATPCCDRASVWETLDTITPDGQRARPASLKEAAQWLNEWPYRSRDDEDSDPEELSVAAQGSEVRCYGQQPDGGVLNNDDDDEVVLRGLRGRRDCVYTKWQAWAGRDADEPQRERHWVGIDGKGYFRGRVEYWRPD